MSTEEPFATVTQLADTLRTSLDVDDPQAIQALRAATAFIRARTRQHLSLVADETFALDGRSRYGLLLPELPVVEICQVVTLDDDGTETALADTDYRADRAGILWRLDGDVWPWGHANVRVGYDHGYATIPDDIVEVCCNLAVENYNAAATVGGITDEQIGTYQVAYDSSTAQTAELGSRDKTILDRYTVAK